MTLSDFFTEYDNLSASRRREGWEIIFKELCGSSRQVDNNDELLKQILNNVLLDYEEEDYFGTEGLNV